MTLHTWRVSCLGDSAHSYPLDDELDHEPTPQCVCGPTLIDAQHADGTAMDLYVHHTLSGYEEGP